MPFATEEMYQLLREREAEDLLMNRPAGTGDADMPVLAEGEKLQLVITALRDVRARAGIKPKDRITVAVNSEATAFYNNHQYLLQRSAGIETLSLVTLPPAGWQTLVVGTDKLYIEPLAGNTDSGAGAVEAMQKELVHLRGFLISVDKKLQNEKFMQHAQPQVIAAEEKKKADALAKIAVLEESLGMA